MLVESGGLNCLFTKLLSRYKSPQRRQKQTKHVFSLPIKDPTNNYYSMSHFNQPNLERKNCLWTTKYKKVLEMCIVQDVETKSVFTFQPKK